jgi:hypothetical protein
MLRDQSILSADLRQRLERIGTKLSKGLAVDGEIETMVGLLGELSPAAITRAEGEIANAAQLWRWQEPGAGSLFVLFGARRSHAQLLQRHDNLKYLFLFHRDGRVRETALRKIVEGLPGPFFVAAIAWRLNDWAAPVRTAALACAQRTFPSTSDIIVARAALGLHLRKNNWGRWNSEREILEEALARPVVAQHLAGLLINSRTGPASRVLREAMRSDALDRHLETIARTAAQPAVRASAVRMLLSGEAVWHEGFESKWIDKSMALRRRVATVGRRKIRQVVSPDRMMALAAADPFVAVRKVAIDMLIREPGLFTDRHAIADRLARDPNAAIRERATFVLEHS